MGLRARNGNDRLRTIWTPEMDRHFIQLLVDQVSKGNKFDDHFFSKRAWKNMTSLFNAKFKFQYEKDVLKNRHKTLRNLYKAVKRLLNQTGFSWDENRQMVTADNSIWDEYVKMHPNARAYRIKTIPYYKELCLIYGDANVEDKGDNEQPSLPAPIGIENENVAAAQPNSTSGGAVEMSVDDDYRICVSEAVIDVSASKGVVDDVQQPTSTAAGNSRTRTYWQPSMDRYFIDLMLEQLRKGNQIDGVFRKQAWMDMLAAFNAKFGFNYDVDVLKNRYKTLRRQHNLIKNLLEMDGFAWDGARQMVTADDYVWQDYIKTHTDARQFMTRPIPYYKDLCIICSDQNFDQSDYFSAQCFEPQNDVPEVKFSGISQSSQSLSASVSSEDKIGDTLERALTDSNIFASNQNTKPKLENWPNSAHHKRPQGMFNAIHEMDTVVSSMSDKRKEENSNPITIESVVEAIQTLPDMDEDLILDACDFLEDDMKAKTFMALDVKLRKKWLLRKLRPES